MKTLKKVSNITLIILVMVQVSMLAQKEIPITTSSKEALKLYMDGRDKTESFELAAASSLFDQAIEKDNNFALAYLYRSQSGGGSVLYRQNLDKAVSLIDKVSEGEKTLILYNQASADGNGKKQLECLEKLLKLFPSDKRVQMVAAWYYFYLNDNSKALSHANKAIQNDKNFATAHMMVGYCQSNLNNYPEAEKAMKAYIKLIPDKTDGYDSYGDVLIKMGKYDESIAQYKKAIEKNPESLYSLVGIGNNNIFKGDFETARKSYRDYYDKATIIDFKFNALYWITVSYVYQNNLEMVTKSYEEAIALAEKEKLPNEVISLTETLGWILTEAGNLTEGLNCYNKAIDLVGKTEFSEADKENFTTSSLIWQLEAYAVNNELDKATVQYEKCLAKVESRKNPYEIMWLNGRLAYLELKKGNYDKAIELYSKNSEDNPFNWYYKAIAYSKKGDKQNATKLFEKIVKYNVNSIHLALVRKRAMDELKK